jgi:hypothetical protein
MAALLLLAAGAGMGHAQDAAPARQQVILVLQHPLDTEAETTFGGVITEAVRLTLRRNHLEARFEEAPERLARASLEKKTADLAGLLRQPAHAGVDFLLLAEYAVEAQALDLRLLWFDPKSQRAGPEVTRRGRRDLALDRVILAALEELLAGVQEQLAVRGPSAAGGSSAATAAPAGPGGTAAAPQGVPEARARPARQRHFEIGLGCAPFVPTGMASEYFKLGVYPALGISYVFGGRNGRLALGFSAGMSYFSASGSTSTADTYLVPLGALLRYEIGGERYPGVFLGLAGGAALMIMDSSASGLRYGWTPCGRGTLGVRLPLSAAFGIHIELGYDVFWEQPAPIMGLSPMVLGTLRL